MPADWKGYILKKMCPTLIKSAGKAIKGTNHKIIVIDLDHK